MVWNRLYWIVLLMWFMATPLALADTTEPHAARANKKPPVATAAEISKWIAQLDDDRYLVRERATRQLMESGGGGSTRCWPRPMRAAPSRPTARFGFCND